MTPGSVSVLAVALALAGCGGGRATDGAGSSGPRPPDRTAGASSLPDPGQLPPQQPLAPLTAGQVDAVVAAALDDPPLAAAIAQGVVTQVLVRAVSSGPSSSGPTGEVAFLFGEQVRPSHVPWQVLCDIGGQTPLWRGVVARVVLAPAAVESSPLWLTGANCVGMTVPDDVAPSTAPGPTSDTPGSY